MKKEEDKKGLGLTLGYELDNSIKRVVFAFLFFVSAVGDSFSAKSCSNECQLWISVGAPGLR